MQGEDRYLGIKPLVYIVAASFYVSWGFFMGKIKQLTLRKGNPWLGAANRGKIAI
jgi:hypothetical protein